MQRVLFLLILSVAQAACAERPEFWPPMELPPAEGRVITAASAIERELVQADALVEAMAYDEAVDVVVRLASESGNELLTVADDVYVPVALACQAHMGRWPAEALAAYRGRVDATAGGLLETARASRNRGGLEQVATTYRLSSHGDDALLALADLALEAGEHQAARGYLLQISPALAATLPGNDAAYQATGLVYPDSDVPVSELLARLAMVSIRGGSLDRATHEAAVLAEQFPDAIGAIGGRQAILSEAVNQTLAAARSWPAIAEPTDWPTTAVSATRSHVVVERDDISRVQWKHKLAVPPIQLAPPEPQFFVGGNRVVLPQPPPATPSYIEPLVAGNAVVIENDGKWIALDAASGKPLFGERGELASAVVQPVGDPGQRTGRINLANPNGGRFVFNDVQIQVGGRIVINQGGGHLIIENNAIAAEVEPASPVPLAMLDGQLLYAVLTDGSDPSPAERMQPRPKRLVALDLAAEGKLLLELEPERTERISGPPVVVDNQVYLPLRETDSTGRLSIASYSRSNGRKLWQTPVCSISGDIREPLGDTLVAGQGMVFLSTSAGVVVGVRADNGQVAWARTYQRGSSTEPNDLTQVRRRSQGACALVEGGLVCAPADAAAMFCLEPTTGRVLWVNYQAFDVEHLLGVAVGRLVATGRQLWLLDANTGHTEFAWPDTPGAGIAGAGRGCLAGDEVFWPTGRAIYTLSVATGQQTRQPIDLEPLGSTQGANVVPCGQGLLVSTEKQLTLLGSAFVPQDEEDEPRGIKLGSLLGF